ncbi:MULTISPECIES: hypothetical protein [unclassified Streptomyces]|uniref:hypothetical protein n=1 Tax=unclassified Streptomyces TaxID=2593676 RepID=UPI003077D682
MQLKRASLAANIGSGVFAGVAGTAVMTAFQKLVEMPVSNREDSYFPATFAERILPVHPAGPEARKRLNYATHFSLGGMWGTAYGIAATTGLRGQKAVNTVFATVYTGDVLLNIALGLYQPTQWSKKDWIVDLLGKYVQAQATGAAFDHFFGPARRS